ncbi:hypothetical protein LEP1GSC193_3624 [Leptospira alstonii serovar Pingchang str. 80-412]|uniref:Uncharacterized protein n=2 Tax=Leptospira alstonii TaxID=28452 RepID=M6D0D5_9LEPT|nr:hypothetical protein LEP1GSC194_0758 [Leptospira alstonii serovar Sichuan str. 79601]EQA81215.1 hypothetical protein LEP1GSC193_3624 [Leptospira alstonii serovar Pingchang str. 80-412]
MRVVIISDITPGALLNFGRLSFFLSAKSVRSAEAAAKIFTAASREEIR